MKSQMRKRLMKILFKKTWIEFCAWSKENEWRDGTKQLFIKSDWEQYIDAFTAYKSPDPIEEIENETQSL